METKHTQGQWEMEYHECRKTYDDTIYPMQIATAETYICQRVEGLTKEQSIANAKLIASAPELLEQLESRERLISGFLEKIEEIASSDKSQAKQNEEFMFLIGSYKRTFENALNTTRKAIKKATN